MCVCACICVHVCECTFICLCIYVCMCQHSCVCVYLHSFILCFTLTCSECIYWQKHSVFEVVLNLRRGCLWTRIKGTAVWTKREGRWHAGVTPVSSQTPPLTGCFQLPPELPLRLPHLRYLDLSYNQLEQLPSSFGLLFHLQTLLVQHNRLRALPSTFTRLVKLEKVGQSRHYHHHLFLNRESCWGTTDDFTTSFLHFSLFSTALLVNSRPVHSLMLSAHVFLCLPCLLPPFTVPCKMVLARPDERETWPYHCSLRPLTIVRKSLCGPVACWILARTSSLVTWSLYEMCSIFR